MMILAQSGSILEPQNKGFLKDLLKNENQFNQLFLEGLTSTEGVQIEDQGKLLKSKQQIFVKGHII